VVGNLIWILLEIYCSLQQGKNFGNRSRIDKVIAMDRVAPFFLTHSVDAVWVVGLGGPKESRTGRGPDPPREGAILGESGAHCKV